MLSRLMSFLSRPARIANTKMGVGRALLATLGATAIGTVHRGAGFYFPHHVWFREIEKQFIGTWAPSTIEHAIGGFGLVATIALVLASGKFTATVRNRTFVSLIVGLVYFFCTAIHGTYQHYLLTNDPAKLWEIAGDALGTLSAVLWVSWPRAANKAQFALKNA